MENSNNDLLIRFENRCENQRNKLQSLEIKVNRLETNFEDTRDKLDDIKNIQIVELERVTNNISTTLTDIKGDFKVIKYSTITFITGLIASQIGLIELIKKLIL